MLATSERDWARALEREQPRFAVLYEDNFNYLTKMCLLRMRQAAMTMIEMAREQGCIVLVCSSDATDHAGEYLSCGAHFILVGEGEETLGELIDHLTGRTGVDLEAVPGLAYADPNDCDRIVRTPSRKVIEDLDGLPRPAWDLVDVDRYREAWRRRHGRFSMNIVTSRGCPFHCNWCAKPIWGQRYNVRSPGSVASEMQWLKERYAPDHLWIMDDLMGIKPGWIARLADCIEGCAATIPFKCLTRVDLLLRPGEIEALRRAGCEIVWTGAESGSQRILDAMDKGTTVDQTREVAEKLHRAGIRVGFFLQLGYPGETRADLEKTFQLVRDCRPDQIGVSVSYPLPGTDFYRAVEGQLGTKRNWVDSDDLAMMYRGPFTTAFYRKAHEVLHKEFRVRAAWRKVKKALRQPTRFGWMHLREIVAMGFHLVTLPVARIRMERLSRAPHSGIGELPRTKSREAAATPSRY